MNKRESYHHGDLKGTLLELAHNEIEANGVECLSLRDLAQRAGVSKTAPYRHFAGIDDLLVLVAATAMNNLADTMEAQAQRATQAMQTAETGGMLESVAGSYIDYALSKPRLFRFLFSLHGMQLQSPGCLAAGKRAQDTLARAIINTTGSDVGIELAVASCWAYYHGLATLLLEGLVDREFFEAQRSAFLQNYPSPKFGDK